MQTKLRFGAITDEFSPGLETAARTMAGIGMSGAEVRVIFGKNILALSDDELGLMKEIIGRHGLEIVSIASPLLKCVLPDAPPVDSRFQQDVFGSTVTFEDQPRLAERAFEVAKQTGARIVRVFSYWRTVQPEKCFDRIVAALADLAEKASRHDLIIGLENEHACNVSTGAETARVLAALDHPNLKVVWDPANALVAGEDPFPFGYRQLPARRIVHVHAKDCHMDGHKPLWGPLGTRAIDWKGQIQTLLADGYRGYINLETHWPGPNRDKLMASIICGWNLKGLLMEQEVK